MTIIIHCIALMKHLAIHFNKFPSREFQIYSGNYFALIGIRSISYFLNISGIILSLYEISATTIFWINRDNLRWMRIFNVLNGKLPPSEANIRIGISFDSCWKVQNGFQTSESDHSGSRYYVVGTLHDDLSNQEFNDVRNWNILGPMASSLDSLFCFGCSPPDHIPMLFHYYLHIADKKTSGFRMSSKENIRIFWSQTSTSPREIPERTVSRYSRNSGTQLVFQKYSASATFDFIRNYSGDILHAESEFRFGSEIRALFAISGTSHCCFRYFRFCWKHSETCLSELQDLKSNYSEGNSIST